MPKSFNWVLIDLDNVQRKGAIVIVKYGVCNSKTFIGTGHPLISIPSKDFQNEYPCRIENS